MKRTFLSLSLLLVIAGGGVWLYRAHSAPWITRASSPGPEAAAQGEDHSRHAAPQGAKQEVPSAPAQAQRKILYWYDPMHPAYKSDKPGIAPDCGMDLVPKYADESAPAKELPPGTVQISTERQQLIGVQTSKVKRQHVARTLRAVGRVAIDETRVAHIHTKVTGYVEEVFANFIGKPVRKGDALFTIYSPELVSTQEEYLLALRGQKTLKDSPYAEVSGGAASVLRAARERLRLWDMSEEEIVSLEREGKPKRTITIFSPVSGIVTDRAAYHHGRYVTPDMDLYTITDLSSVWVLADLFEFEGPYVKLGQEAAIRLSYFPGKTYSGTVSFIFPNVDPKTRTIRVRISLPNAEADLKPDMFADVELAVDYGTHIVVPQEAVLDTGTQKIVFVAREGGYFEPRPIQAGPRLVGLAKDSGSGDQIVVLSGLRPGETIVTSGNFLIDSESRMKGAAEPGKHQHP